VTQHPLIADEEQSGLLLGKRRRHRTDQVNAAMHLTEATGLNPPLDLSRCHPGVEELPSRNHAVLAAGER
jgi:hypothetical protein